MDFFFYILVIRPISHQAFLTYLEKNEPFVYLQLLPDCEKNLEKINQLINEIVEKNQHNSSYEIGDHVVAQFTDDSNYYRAQIQSYSSETQRYTVFFLDYGNQDDNVAETELFSYTNELQNIEAQAHRYRLEKINSSMWINTVRSMIEEQKLNDQVEFHWIDQENNLIHIKFTDEEKIYQLASVMPQTASGNISAYNRDCFFVHLLPDADSLICEMDELIQNLVKQHRDENETWSLDDLCIVFDSKENRSFRGRILKDHDDSTFDVQCIDYGNILTYIKTDHLYILNDEEVKNRSPLARQCRLFGVNDENQIKAIDEVIQFISPTELVTITIQNDPNESCLLVMLFREDHQIVNDQYQIDSEIRVRRHVQV